MPSELLSTVRMFVLACDLSDLCEDQVLRAAAVQAQYEADRLEKLLDARPELVLLHPAGGSRVKDTRLDDELEQVLQGLGGFGRTDRDIQSAKVHVGSHHLALPLQGTSTGWVCA